jgi:5-methylcytosine-specific restriction endonuclease McrA
MSKAYKYAWDKIHKEIENCIILCANCHREKTIKEKDYMEADWVEEESPQFDLL